MKRKPSLKTRNSHLMAWWDSKEDDLMLNWPKGSQTKSDSHLLYGLLCQKPLTVDFKNSRCGHVRAEKSFLEELEARGYDVTTLRFSVELKPGARKVARSFF